MMLSVCFVDMLFIGTVSGMSLTTHHSLFFLSPDHCKTNKVKRTRRGLAGVPPSDALSML
jgi:hypothetical protein